MESASRLTIENWHGLSGVMHKEFSPAADDDAKTFIFWQVITINVKICKSFRRDD